MISKVYMHEKTREICIEYPCSISKEFKEVEFKSHSEWMLVEICPSNDSKWVYIGDFDELP